MPCISHKLYISSDQPVVCFHGVRGAVREVAECTQPSLTGWLCLSNHTFSNTFLRPGLHDIRSTSRVLFPARCRGFCRCSYTRTQSPALTRVGTQDYRMTVCLLNGIEPQKDAKTQNTTSETQILPGNTCKSDYLSTGNVMRDQRLTRWDYLSAEPASTASSRRERSCRITSSFTLAPKVRILQCE